jgi:ferric-dicitrate binding protein FerR (iron transport regulator)
MPDNMDDVFKKKFSDFESEPFLDSKEKIFSNFYEEEPENNKETRKKNFARRRSYFTYLVAASLIGILITVLGYLFNSGYQESEKEVMLEVKEEQITPSKELSAVVKLSKGTSNGKEKNRATLGANKLSEEHSGNPSTIHKKSLEKRQMIMLPDSSRVFLNKYSELTYPAFFDGKDRTVQMEGEVYFEIKKMENRPFIVQTKSAKIKVLGTSFCVKQYPEGRVDVTVESGKVLFSEKGSKKQNEVVLTKGTMASLEPGRPLLPLTPESSNQLSWKTGKLHFQKSLLKVVIEEVGTYFDVKIRIADPKMLNCHFTGNFEHPGSIEEVLDVISLSINGSYEIKNKEYIVTSMGCN